MFLTIRAEQLEVLREESRRRRIAERLETFVRTLHPRFGAALPVEDLRRAIATVVERGVEREELVRRYVELTVSDGLVFENDPARSSYGAYLDDPDVSDPHERVVRLLEAVERARRIEEENRRRELAFRKRCRP